LQLSRRLTPAVATEAEMGLQLCYGDLHHWHFLEPKDLGTSVKLANLANEISDHTVDFVHMAVPLDRCDNAYFRPLAGLNLGVGTLYAGLVHYTDGVTGTSQRMAMLNRHYDGCVGISTACELGRLPDDQDLQKKLTIHVEAVEQFGR
jgi:hypothetical protein